MSESGSVPTRSAGTSSCRQRADDRLRVLPATWWLVTTCPSGVMMVPLPTPPALSRVHRRGSPRQRECGRDWAQPSTVRLRPQLMITAGTRGGLRGRRSSKHRAGCAGPVSTRPAAITTAKNRFHERNPSRRLPATSCRYDAVERISSIGEMSRASARAQFGSCRGREAVRAERLRQRPRG